MIPNNPVFSNDVDPEPLVEFLPTPPKSVVGEEAMAIGGLSFEGSEKESLNFTRHILTYWSITPVGVGSGVESKFEIRKFDYQSNTWSLVTSLDAQFEDYATVKYLSVAFDNDNRMFASYKDHTGVNLFWYDSRIGQYITTPYGEANAPTVYHDGGAYGAHANSDVMFFHARDKVFYMSNSSEFFMNEYDSIPVAEDLGIESIGITPSARLQIKFRKIPLGVLDFTSEICDNQTTWVTLDKNPNNIKRC